MTADSVPFLGRDIGACGKIRPRHEYIADLLENFGRCADAEAIRHGQQILACDVGKPAVH